MRVPVPAQSSYCHKTFKNSIQGGGRLDVVICHSCTMLTWRYMELDCTDAPVLLFLASSNADVTDMTCNVKIFIDVNALQFYFRFLDLLVVDIQSTTGIRGINIS